MCSSRWLHTHGPSGARHSQPRLEEGGRGAGQLSRRANGTALMEGGGPGAVAQAYSATARSAPLARRWSVWHSLCSSGCCMMRRWQHTHSPPGARPPPAVAGEGGHGRVARMVQHVLVPPLAVHKWVATVTHAPSASCSWEGWSRYAKGKVRGTACSSHGARAAPVAAHK
jgi:hypothetical protein